MSSTPRPSIFRKFWKPAAATGTSGIVLVFWFEELMLYVEDLLTLAFVSITAGVIYLFDNFVFNSSLPKSEDDHNTTDIGAK